jgi:histone demethylase JARID1
MLPPYTQTLFVELIRFSPGQPDNVTSTGPTPRGNPPPVYPSGPVAPSSHYRSANSNATSHTALPPSPISMTTTFGAGGTDLEPGSVNSVIPPPPWSRWGIVNTPNRPPATTRRQAPDSSPPQISRKRKHADDVHSSEETSAPKRPLIQAMPEPSPSIPPPSVHVLSSPPVPPSPRPIQSVSPSLARLLTPSTESSPKTAHAPYGPPKPPPPHSNGRGADSPMSESG